jgi:predicted dehydrogenase
MPTDSSPASTDSASTIPHRTNPPKRLRFLVIGAGSRGQAYAEAVGDATSAVIHAVAEPHSFKRTKFGKKYIWGPDGSPREGQAFADWKDWLSWEQERRRRRADERDHPVGVDGVFVCSLDETHVHIVRAVAPLDLHILCEKPLATSLADCLSIYRALVPAGDPRAAPTKIFSIGHVLRYSPHNLLLRKMLLVDRVIGDIVSIEHCEPVGWWHFAHSYVRGHWRRRTPNGDGTLLTKSCHDIDFILWLLSSPPPGAPREMPPHEPRIIASMGALTQFRRARKPAAAGSATNCLACPAERDCGYSAWKIYGERHLAQRDTAWPVNIVCPDIEDTLAQSGMAAAEELLRRRLREDYDRATTADGDIAARPWYGRCVYESDNDVCDDQVVTIAWDDDPSTRRLAKTASVHMIAPTERICERRGRVYGTHGELDYDSRCIRFYAFDSQSTSVVDVPQSAEKMRSHGGGDHGLTRAFIGAVDAVENRGWPVRDAQTQHVGCTLEDAVRSHAVVFAAEEARREEKVVHWKEWWEERLKAFDVGAVTAINAS